LRRQRASVGNRAQPVAQRAGEPVERARRLAADGHRDRARARRGPDLGQVGLGRPSRERVGHAHAEVGPRADATQIGRQRSAGLRQRSQAGGDGSAAAELGRDALEGARQRLGLLATTVMTPGPQRRRPGGEDDDPGGDGEAGRERSREDARAAERREPELDRRLRCEIDAGALEHPLEPIVQSPWQTPARRP
jgi:hypothetical protein